MSIEVVMPKAGLTMVEGTISEWKVAEGAYVRKGDVLMEYENEKNTIEYEALEEGYIHIVAQEGDKNEDGELIPKSYMSSMRQTFRPPTQQRLRV